MATCSAAEALHYTPGQYRDASGRCNDTPDGYTDLAEILRRLMDGVYRSLFLSRMSAYRLGIFMITLRCPGGRQ